MNRRKNLIMTALAVVISALMTVCVWRTESVSVKMEQTQEHMAEEVLRFHVLANSDSKQDQNLKMKVKDTVINWMEEEMTSGNLEETKEFVRSHLSEIEDLASGTIQEEGYMYPVKVSLEKTAFPEKTYGDVTFPSGIYEALRIQIGQAEGHNWWCVLYPNLCFIDSVRAVVPESGKKQLKNVLTEDEYEMVTASSRFKVRWFFFGS